MKKGPLIWIPFFDKIANVEKINIGMIGNYALCRNNTKGFERSVFFMPKNKFQDFVFTLIMVFVMVYAMVVYNIAGDRGGLTYETFGLALMELPIMVPVGFILEFFFVGRMSQKIVFRHMSFQDKPIMITFFISGVTVAMMCPLMSFVACCIFKGIDANLFTNWLTLTAHNLPMAFFWQFMYAGPFVRFVFGKIFSGNEDEEMAVEEAMTE